MQAANSNRKYVAINPDGSLRKDLDGNILGGLYASCWEGMRVHRVVSYYEIIDQPALWSSIPSEELQKLMQQILGR